MMIDINTIYWSNIDLNQSFFFKVQYDIPCKLKVMTFF